MSTELMNIAAFKGMKPSAAFAALDPNAENLADGIGSSYGIIGYKGKVWSLRLRGETHTFNRPDEPGVAAPYLDVIILRQLAIKSKTYYPPNTYVEGTVGTRPVCAALDGVTPDADIANPQSTSCAVCPKNVFKVAADGRKSRDCADYKRLAVLVLPSQTKQLLGAPLMEPVFLRVPPGSLNDLALLGEGMGAQGFHFSSFVTRIGFVQDKSHPKFTFRALIGLDDRAAAMVLPLRDDPVALRITGESEIMLKPQRVAVAAPVAPAVDNVVPITPKAAPAAQPAPVQVAPAAIETGFEAVTATVAAAPKAAPAAQPAPAPVVDTGFGDLAPAPTPVAAAPAAPVVNTVADTGAPEEVDLDLDARVAALFPTA